jgi:hypothetical protein
VMSIMRRFDWLSIELEVEYYLHCFPLIVRGVELNDNALYYKRLIRFCFCLSHKNLSYIIADGLIRPAGPL